MFFCDLPALKLKRRTDDDSLQTASVVLLHYASSVFVGWARDDGSSIAVWPRDQEGGGGRTTTKKTEPTKLNVFGNRRAASFRAAALKTLVIDYCETGASMQVGLVSRSSPPTPRPTPPHPPKKLRTRDPLPTAFPRLATTYSLPYQVPTYSQLPSLTLLLVVTTLLATYLPEYLWQLSH